jgi:hypothetical protein
MRVSESFFVALEFNSVSENDSRAAVNRHITGSLQVEGQLEKTVLHSQLPHHSTGIDPKGNWVGAGRCVMICRCNGITSLSHAITTTV